MINLFSYFKAPITNVQPLKDMTLKECFDTIVSKHSFKALTKQSNKLFKEYLKEGDKKPYTDFKALKFPFVIFSGNFERRSLSGLKNPTQYACFDLDPTTKKVDPTIFDRVVEALKKDSLLNPLLIFKSPSGFGLKVIVSFPLHFKLSKKHSNYTHLYKVVCSYLEHTYKDLLLESCLKVDSSTKDVTRPCFLCYDPKAYLNPKLSLTIKKDNLVNLYDDIEIKRIEEKYKKNPTPQPAPPTSNSSNYKDITHTQKVEHCIKQLEQEQKDITAGYQNWLSIGFSIASEFGETGRDYYHRVSQFYPHYTQGETDKKYDNLVKSNTSLSIGTFYAICKKHGATFKELYHSKSSTRDYSEFNSNDTDSYLKIQKGVTPQSKEPQPQNFKGLDINPIQDFKTEAEKQAEKEKELLDQLLLMSNQIKGVARTKIEFKPALVSLDGTRIIEQNTINGIQGSYGSHKSRLAEMFTALFLSKNPNPNDFCGFSKNLNEEFTVAFVDTERNILEQFPYAIQKICNKAGSTVDALTNFNYTSLIGTKRSDRFTALKTYIKHLRSENDNHIFCVLDIVTDCVTSFNDTNQMNAFFDFLNVIINETNTTFLLVIHENPGSEKARGHLGSEMINKSSGQIRISLDKDNQNNKTGLIKVEFKKLRNAAPPHDQYLYYDDITHGLAVADDTQIQKVAEDSKYQKASLSDVRKLLVKELPLNVKQKQQKIYSAMMKEFKCSKKTATERIKELLDLDAPIDLKSGVCARLKREKTTGKTTFLKLVKFGEEIGSI